MTRGVRGSGGGGGGREEVRVHSRKERGRGKLCHRKLGRNKKKKKIGFAKDELRGGKGNELDIMLERR